MKKNYLKNLPLILLAGAIAFSPSFSAGEIKGGRIIEIRVEDILLVILGLIWIANFLISGRKKIEKPPLFLPILAWLGIGFLSVLTNWLFMNIALSRGFFYFLKEVEFFFLYFYLFYHIKNLDSAKFLIKTWIVLGLVNAGWIIFELISGLKLTYWYGPTAFIEPEGTLPSGGFFLIIFIFLFNVFLYYYLEKDISFWKKGVLAAAVLSPAVGVFSSGSRASFSGLIFALILTFLFYFLRRRGLKPFLMSMTVLILICLIFISVSLKISRFERFINWESFRFELTKETPGTRFHIWKVQLSEALKHPFFLFFGLGKSVRLIHEESHSQYIRNFIETGLIGSFIFFFLFFIILKKSWQGFSREKDRFLIGLSAGLLVTTLSMLVVAISAEVFIVVKISEVYWFFTALTMTYLSLHNKQQTLNPKP